MATKEVTIENFQSEVLECNVPVLVDFWASWCGPCRMVSPIIDELSDEHPEYKFAKVNVDEQIALANKYNVMSIPNLVVFNNGEVVSQVAGTRQKEEILEFLKNILGSSVQSVNIPYFASNSAFLNLFLHYNEPHPYSY